MQGKTYRFRRWSGLVLGLGIAVLLLPFPAHAQVFFMNVCWLGIACMNWNTFGLNLTNSLFAASSMVCVAIFLVGTLFMVFSAGNDTPLQKGKGMMTGSLIGLAVTVGAFAIWRTVTFILYAGP